jgi:hypothetical protein
VLKYPVRNTFSLNDLSASQNFTQASFQVAQLTDHCKGAERNTSFQPPPLCVAYPAGHANNSGCETHRSGGRNEKPRETATDINSTQRKAQSKLTQRSSHFWQADMLS